jgi:hypothetical protein
MNGPKSPAFIHFRRPKYAMQFTACLMYGTSPTNSLSKIGFSFCSKKDNFSKKIGRRISKGRIDKNILDLIHFPNDVVDKYKGTYDCLKAIVDAFSKEIDITQNSVSHSTIKCAFYNSIDKIKNQ